MTRRLGWIVVLFCQLALVLTSGEACAQKRVALVIGNSNYQYTRQLANPVNDAGDLAAELTRVGFIVDFEHDLTKKGMEEAIARFARLAQGADAALFFYAGHGMQYRGENYLMPVDARLQDEFSLNFELTRLDDVLFGLERAQGVKILILDACRNNPLLEHLLRTTKSASRDLIATHGLAKVDVARGMLVAYSTQPNQVAVDGTGRNSPFTSALVKYIAVPGLEVGTLFRRVAIEVNRVTKGRQLPELSVSLVGEFYLNTQDTDVQAWSKIRGTDNTTKLNDFLKTYPTSPLVAEAQEKLDAIARQERARIEREQAEHDRQEKEALARDEAERKRLELEHQAKAAQEKLDKERIAQAQQKAQAELDAKAQAEAAKKAASEKSVRAEPDRATPAEPDDKSAGIASTESESSQKTKLAMLPPANESLRSQSTPDQSAPNQSVQIPSVLKCSAFSTNPIRDPAFASNISFIFSNGILAGKRTTKTHPGEETYSGTVSRTGEIRIKGYGRFYHGSAWTYEFSGHIGAGATVQGRLVATKGPHGARTCSITFRMPILEFKTKLGLLESNSPSEQRTPEADSKPETKSEKNESESPSKAHGNGPKIFLHEPPRGINALRLGEIVYIDDKSCPKGQIKEMTAGHLRRGIPRRYRCIDRSSMAAGSHQERVASRPPTETPSPENKRSTKSSQPSGDSNAQCAKMHDKLGCECALQTGGWVTQGRWHGRRGDDFVKCEIAHGRQ